MTLEKISRDEIKELCTTHNVPVRFLPDSKDMADAIIDCNYKIELKNWQAPIEPLSPAQYYDKVWRRHPDVIFTTSRFAVSHTVTNTIPIYTFSFDIFDADKLKQDGRVFRRFLLKNKIQFSKPRP